SPSDRWMHSHNVVHHTWTNVHGKDPDIGYGVLRVTDDQRWHAKYLFNPVINFVLMMMFQWGVALHDLEADKLLAGKKSFKEIIPMLKRIGWKVRHQLLKDYVCWPVLGAAVTVPVTVFFGFDVVNIALAGFGFTIVANLIANGIRNIWSNVIIFCGHFPAGVHHFTKEEVEGETRAAWYVRQLLGSCNITGGKLFHILSGNLSHQIEHHLFPDIPANRYAEMSPRVQALAARYGLPYNKGSFTRQFGTTTWNIWRLSLP
ncbi:MAG: acyl-CoA desaturase, partial [Sutterellaceae bacterium]|nr:acyl-CoA desaturase [Sutterellaceae bacterium]